MIFSEAVVLGAVLHCRDFSVQSRLHPLVVVRVEIGANPAHPRVVVDPVCQRHVSALLFGSFDPVVARDLLDGSGQRPRELSGRLLSGLVSEFEVAFEQGVSVFVAELVCGGGERIGVLGRDPAGCQLALDLR